MAFVPVADGVPMVAGGNLAPTPGLVSSDTTGALGNAVPATPLWGIFLNGNVVITADNVISLEYKQDWDILDYPVEQGGFETYNKVQLPFEIKLEFSSGGSVSNRQALLDSVAAIAGDTNLYDVHMPEEFYSNMNIMHYSFERRSTNGVGLIKVGVWLRQIRQDVQAASNPGLLHTVPTATSLVSDGTVQASILDSSKQTQLNALTIQ